MSHQIYPALSGATATWHQVEAIANNLANANTTGFKQTRVSFDNVLHDVRPLGDGFTRIGADGIDMTDGAIRHTGVETDVALQGDGFLLVESSDGQEYLSRDGNLRLDSQRFLVNQRGDRVQGLGGPINIPIDEVVEIDLQGNVASRRSDGSEVMTNQLGRLRLVTADNLQSMGGNHYIAPDGYQEALDVRVVNGAVEQSNTNPMVAMVDLIQANRYFDVYQKAIQTSDTMDSQVYQLART